MSTAEDSAAKGGSATADSQADRIYLVSYPKIVFLWPSFVAALVAAIFMSFAGVPDPEAEKEARRAAAAAAADQAEGADDAAVAQPKPEKQPGMPGQAVVGWLFLVVLSVNLVVLSFDFPRATSLIVFFVIVAIALGLWLVGVKFPNMLPAVGNFFAHIEPIANATFYWFFVTVMGVIYVGVWINTRFDYWEVRPNELLHHHGVLSDLKRISAPHMRIDKEINDIFEYLLLGSGRLILTSASEQRAIVLENVPWISSKEKAITRMLGALQVKVRSDG